MGIIDKKYYEGRNFHPLQMESTKSGSEFQTAIGPNGCCCIAITAPNLRGSRVHLAVAPYPNPPGISQSRIVSFSDKPADFSSNAQQGPDCSPSAVVGGGRGVLSLEAGKQYFLNVANAKADALGPDMRLTVTFTGK